MTQGLPYSSNLLIIEDSNEDFEALRRVLAQVSTASLAVSRCIDGDDALDFLHYTGKYSSEPRFALPELILLDLNLPGTDGREVLYIIKQNEHLKAIPVVVLTTSANPKDIAICYQSGANSYMLKPMDINELKNSVQTLLNYWFKVTVLPNSLRPKMS